MTAKLIEFLGMPRAGKSTQIRLLRRALIQKGHTVKVMSDRARTAKMATPVTERIAYELVFFSGVLEEYMKCRNSYNYIIIDRGFYDSAIWFEVEKIVGGIPAKRVDELKTTFTEYTERVDKLVCMMVDPTLALKRHAKTKHMHVDEVGMDRKYLDALMITYKQSRENFGNHLYISRLDTRKNIHSEILNFVLS